MIKVSFGGSYYLVNKLHLVEYLRGKIEDKIKEL